MSRNDDHSDQKTTNDEQQKDEEHANARHRIVCSHQGGMSECRDREKGMMLTLFPLFLYVLQPDGPIDSMSSRS